MADTEQSATYRRLVAEEWLICAVAEEIAGALEECGWDHADLAYALGRSKRWVRKVMAGDKIPNLREVAQIAHALGCEFEVKLVPAPT